MTDREKVIKGLECCVRTIYDWECADNCPYETQCWDGTMYLDLMRDALALLKAQQPIEPKLGGNAGVFGTWWYQCGACSGQINPGDKYCNNCGRSVKWATSAAM